MICSHDVQIVDLVAACPHGAHLACKECATKLRDPSKGPWKCPLKCCEETADEFQRRKRAQESGERRSDEMFQETMASVASVLFGQMPTLSFEESVRGAAVYY